MQGSPTFRSIRKSLYRSAINAGTHAAGRAPFPRHIHAGHPFHVRSTPADRISRRKENRIAAQC